MDVSRPGGQSKMEWVHLAHIDLEHELQLDESALPKLTDQNVRFEFEFNQQIHHPLLTLKFTKRRKKRGHDNCQVELSCESLVDDAQDFGVLLQLEAAHKGISTKQKRFDQHLKLHKLVLKSFTGQLKQDVITNYHERVWNHIHAISIDFYRISPKIKCVPRTLTGRSSTSEHSQAFSEIRVKPEATRWDGRFMLRCAQEKENTLYYVHSHVMGEASTILDSWIQDEGNKNEEYNVGCSASALSDLLQLVYIGTVSDQFASNLSQVLVTAQTLIMPTVTQACATEVLFQLHNEPSIDLVKDLLCLVSEFSLDEDRLIPLTLKSLAPILCGTDSELSGQMLSFVNTCLKKKSAEKLNGWWVAVMNVNNEH